jgi:hypothetical protein
MRKSILLVVMCVIYSINYAQESTTNIREKKNQSSEANETISFDKTEHDFVLVSEAGGVVECVFTVKNTGKSPLVISKVTASCGCTAPDWSKDPIAPGNEGTITAKFNPKGRSGAFAKLITVYSNANPSRKSLTIKGFIQ